MFRFIGTRLPVFRILTICAAHLIVAGPAAAALESGFYLTTPGATVRERGDRVPNKDRTVPVSAAFTFDLESAPPSLTAVFANAVLEGGNPFLLTVRSSSGAKLSNGSYRFTGDYMADIQPSGTQYLFDWTFSTATDGHLVWDGVTGWAGGHFWQINISALTLVPDTTGVQLAIAWNGGSQFTLSWPAVYKGYSLEQAATMRETAWSPVPAPVSLTGDRYSVTISSIAPRSFFRLRKT